MFSAKDSLNNLRLARKRANPDERPSSGLTPIDQLRSQVAAKKRQRTQTTGQFNASFPVLLQPKKAKKSVRFDFTRNTICEVAVSSHEEIQARWLSGGESEQIKCMLRVQIAAVQQGLFDVDQDSIRGLEAHADPVLTNERLAKGRNFISRILQQQALLKAMMGKVNELILAKLSSVLSADDSRRAAELGTQDANAAMQVHGTTMKHHPAMQTTMDYKTKLAYLQGKVQAKLGLTGNPQAVFEMVHQIAAGRTC